MLSCSCVQYCAVNGEQTVAHRTSSCCVCSVWAALLHMNEKQSLQLTKNKNMKNPLIELTKVWFCPHSLYCLLSLVMLFAGLWYTGPNVVSVDTCQLMPWIMTQQRHDKQPFSNSYYWLWYCFKTAITFWRLGLKRSVAPIDSGTCFQQHTSLGPIRAQLSILPKSIHLFSHGSAVSRLYCKATARKSRILSGSAFSTQLRCHVVTIDASITYFVH